MSDPLAGVPLASLRVFEAAARLRSFTRAAAELGMTQAAVSWQIKALEGKLGLPLFTRLPREVAPTEAGERLARAATEAMGLLRRALTDLSESDQGLLSITTLSTFATQWLAPRLGAFQINNPDIAVRVDTRPGLVDLEREGFDLGLRAGPGDWPGLDGVRIMSGVFAPLCAPELAERLKLREPADLLTAPRIGIEREWSAWFAAAGVREGVVATMRLEADHQLLEVAAALGGQSVAMGSPILFAREIEAGRLVQPFPQTVELVGGYWLVWPKGRGRSPKVARFRRWLLEAAAADPAVARYPSAAT